MVEIKKRHIIFFLIFLTYFLVRCYFALQTEYFDDDVSYFSLRQIESIIETGKPILKDDLSYGSRTFFFMPFYFFIIGYLTKIILLFLNINPIFIIKIINNFFSSLFLIGIYIIISDLKINRNVSLICSLLGASFPLYINETLNKLNFYSIFIPSLFFFIYLFINLDKENVNYLIFLTIFLTLTTQFSITLLLGLIIYYILSYLENTEIENIKKEYIIFFILFYFWANFIIFKNAILINKINIFWQNVPNFLLENYFSSIDIYSLITSLGILQIFFSIFVIYNYLINRKNKNILFIISMYFSLIILLFLKILPYTFSIILIGSLNIILFGIFWSDFFADFKKTKFFNHEYKVYLLVIISLLIFQLLPTIFLLTTKQRTNSEYYENFKILKEIKTDGKILSIPEEGHLITYFGKKKNVMDTEFLGIDNINKITKDVFDFYKRDLKIENLKILKKYDIQYVLYTEKLIPYNITETNFIKECFDPILNKSNFKLYLHNKTKCEIKSIN